MDKLTFITGNEGKAKYAMKLVGFPITHHNMDLPEIQSLDPKEIVGVKLDTAYNEIQRPVMIEDVSLNFEALNGLLPGPYIKHFLEALGTQGLCDLADDKTRAAVAKCLIGYQDGETRQFFEGSVNGLIAPKPVPGANGFGWDDIFIADGFETSNSSLTKEQYNAFFLKLRRYDLLKRFLSERFSTRRETLNVKH